MSLEKESKLLAKHSVIYGFGNLLNYAASFLLLPVYTRFLTTNDYGIKELVGLSTDVIGILMATAISGAIYRFYFEYEETRDRNEIISSAVIAIGCFGLVALGLLSFFTRTMAKYILNAPELNYFFIISLASLWFQSQNNVAFDYLRANQHSSKFIALSSGKLVSAICLNIYFVCFLRIGVLGVLLSTLLTSVGIWGVLVIPLCRKTGLRFSFEKMKAMVKFGLPLIPSQFGAFIVHLSDRFFIKAYCSVADAGLYSLGYRFGSIPGNFIASPFNQIWLPRRFELYKQEGSEKLFGKIFTHFLTLMIFAGLCVSILSRDVLRVISDKSFWPAYKVVPIIALASIVFTLHYHFNMGILIHKKTKYLAYINFSNGILILALNFLLIPKYGIYGAAFATLIGFVYKVTLTYLLSSRFYEITFEVGRIGKMVLAGFLTYLASLLIHFDVAHANFSAKTILTLVFPALLFVFKFYTREEKDKAMRAIKLL